MPSTVEKSLARQAHEWRDRVVPFNSVRATPVVAVAEAMGYRVYEVSPTDQAREVSGAVDHAKKIIYVNRREGPVRKRFTIAHEIGHVVLHGDEGDFVDYRGQLEYGTMDQPKEREANEFAAELLMPRNVFEALWNAYGQKINSVADQLEVSQAAARVRARELGLI